MRKALLVSLALLAFICATYWLDPTRALQGWLAGESFFEQRPTRYWREHLTDENAAIVEATRARLVEGGDGAVSVLSELLQDSDSARWSAAEIRWTAAELLGQLGPAAGGATPAMIAALNDDDPHVRTVAAANLPAIDAPADQAVPALLALAKREPTVDVLRALSEYEERAREAISELVGILGDRELPTEVRWNAARTLGKIRAPAVVAVGTLVEHLRDEAATIREHSAEALGDIGPPAADAVMALASVLDDPATRVRRDAARSLGQIGPAAAQTAPRLKELLKDPEQIVRDAARVALQTLAPSEPLPKEDVESEETHQQGNLQDADPKTATKGET